MLQHRYLREVDACAIISLYRWESEIKSCTCYPSAGLLSGDEGWARAHSVLCWIKRFLFTRVHADFCHLGRMVGCIIGLHFCHCGRHMDIWFLEIVSMNMITLMAAGHVINIDCWKRLTWRAHCLSDVGPVLISGAFFSLSLDIMLLSLSPIWVIHSFYLLGSAYVDGSSLWLMDIFLQSRPIIKCSYQYRGWIEIRPFFLNYTLFSFHEIVSDTAKNGATSYIF